MKFQQITYCLIAATTLLGCEGFFGTKTSSDFLDVPQFNNQSVAYVPIRPEITGFDRPVDVIAGWDELIYVSDAGAGEIISFDQAGNEQGRFAVPGLSVIAQDRRLDILAGGTLDTVINGNPITLPAIYRLDLNKTGEYGLNNASIKKIIIHPFYFKSSTPTSADANVKFTGITPMADNRYYVARNGPSNSANQFGGPDDAVLLFDDEDEYITPVTVSTSLGLFRDYFKKPQGITSLAMPPQSPAVDQRGDFLFTSIDENAALKVQYIVFSESEFGSSYDVRNFTVGDTSRADGFLYETNKFTTPVDIAIAGDGTGYIFVVDSETDSLYQFNGLGFEGANPPAGSRSNKVVKVSFGGTGIGLTQFSEPSGVAYLNEIVYVADAGNGRLLRFQLTTDFD